MWQANKSNKNIPKKQKSIPQALRLYSRNKDNKVKKKKKKEKQDITSKITIINGDRHQGEKYMRKH